MESDFKLYAITDRHSLPGGGRTLINFIESAVAADVDMIQIREKDMPDRELLALTGSAVKIAAGSRTRILVNDRLDIALASGAAGVHLGGHSALPADIRRAAPPGFLIGFSTHNLQEIHIAVDGRADFVTFGPVFHTSSKAKYGPPVGIDALEEACKVATLPLFPLGGIKEDNYRELLGLPIAGLSSISLFQNAVDLSRIVAEIRRSAQEVE
jgi:thiamine-phosphate pyrophosphorylase